MTGPRTYGPGELRLHVVGKPALVLLAAVVVGGLFHHIYSKPTQRWARRLFERRATA